MKSHRTHGAPRASAAARCASVFFLSITLAAAPAVAVPAVAWADDADQLSSQLDDAKQHLSDLTHQLELAQAVVAGTEQDLSDTQQAISDLETQISETQEQLSGAQAELAEQISADYKNGEVSLVSVLLSSSSFDELASRIYYANKVADAQSSRIDGVRELQTSLEQQQTELSDKEQQLQELLDQQTASAQELASSQAEAESYVNGLSSDLQEALEAERAAAAEEARRQQEQAAQDAPAQNTQPSGNTGNGGGGATNNGGTNNGGGTTGGTTGGSTGGAVGGGSGNLSQSARNTIVSVANSQVGCAYGWGAMNPGVAFDCSGLSSYAYSCAGIGLGHTAQAQYNQVVAAGNLKTDPSSFVPGDLVFWASGGSVYHVAIYIGSGMITHASDYSTGVITTSVYYGGTPCGGGSPI